MTTKAWVAVWVCAQLWGAGLATGADFYDETAMAVLKLQFSQASWYNLLQANYQSKTNLAATLMVDGIVYEGVGVRFRGNTSYQMTQNSQKKSFGIKIDYTIEDQRLLGYKTLNLINCMSDPTFMREVLYSNTCRRQVPSAKANFVRLEINGENWGVYANVQQLNAEFLEDWFPSHDGTLWRADGMAGGQIIGGGGDGGGGGVPPIRRSPGTISVAEMPGGAGMTSGVAALTWLGTNSASYQTAYELKSTQQSDPWAGLIHTCDVLNNTPLAELPDKIESVLNVDRALWICAFEIVFADDDGYVNKRGSDYCLYYEPETGRMHLIQYDGNECMLTAQWSLFYRAEDAAVPIMCRLMAIDRYRQRYLAHVRTILDSLFTEDALDAQIDAYRAVIEAAVKADTKKLYTNQAFDSGITALKSFVQTRRSFLLTDRELARAAPQIVAVRQEVVPMESGQTVIVSAHVNDAVAVSGARLFVAAGPFALFAEMPMADEGWQAVDGAAVRVFRAELPDYPTGTVLRYYVQATAADGVGTLAFDPPGAEHAVYTHLATYPQAATSGIVFNEIMAKNVAVIADPQGEYDDWIELKNVSDGIIDLSGMYVSDSPGNPLKWRFPAGTLIGPGEYLLVWADEDGGDEAGLHANFKLSAGGETIWLFDTVENGHALVDSVTFPSLAGDQSCGRHPDGTGVVQILSAPSPLGPNAEPAAVQDD